jgi:hypothetical protein
MTKKWMPTIAAQLDKHFIGIIISMMIVNDEDDDDVDVDDDDGSGDDDDNSYILFMSDILLYVRI